MKKIQNHCTLAYSRLLDKFPAVVCASVYPADVQKTAITTPFGLFEYKRMPFGLRNAGPSFQRHVDRAIQDCHAAFAWVDDIVICSRNHEEHVIHVRQVLPP